MTGTPHLTIAVLPGDGIGPEVMTPCLELLDQVSALVQGFTLSFDMIDAGAAYYQQHGISLPDNGLARAVRADAILLAAMGLPAIRYPDGTEIAPQLELREALGLYAGVRPIRSIPGISQQLADPRAAHLDFVLIRESTEGLFAARGKTEVVDDRIARDTMVITRDVCERLFDFAFRLARRRKAAGYKGELTCVDKANVLGSFAFFRSIFDETAARYPDVTASAAYVDAVGLSMIKRPWEFDVLVTENMFGDILSDVGAALMGGMGMAPSADIGDKHAVFQPCHGSAPDIIGQGKANPTAMFLSAAMMLDWLGDTCDVPACRAAATAMADAVDAAFAPGTLLPYELGGTAGTRQIVDAVTGEIPDAVGRAIGQAT